VKHIRTFESINSNSDIESIINMARDEGVVVNNTYISEYCTWITVYRYDLGETETGPSDYALDRKKEYLTDREIFMEQNNFCDLVDNMYQRLLLIDDRITLRCRYYTGNTNLNYVKTYVTKNMEVFKDVNTITAAKPQKGAVDIISVEFDVPKLD